MPSGVEVQILFGAPLNRGLPSPLYSTSVDFWSMTTRQTSIIDHLCYHALMQSTLQQQESSTSDHFLSQHQEDALQHINQQLDQSSQAILKGSAGTGKSHLASHFINTRSDRVTLTATTNKAVRVLLEMSHGKGEPPRTVHSFLGLKLVMEQGRQILKRDRDASNETDLLVVDEASMLGRDVMSHIQTAMMEGRVKQLLYVGDPYQLAPVNENRSPALMGDSSMELTNVIRQAAGNPIIEKATELRDMIAQGRHRPVYRLTPAMPTIRFARNLEDFIQTYVMDQRDKQMVSYTNNRVDELNHRIRTKMYGTPDEYMEGERLVAQASLEKDGKMIITNGEMIELSECEYVDNIWRLTTVDGQTFEVIPARLQPYYQQQLESLRKNSDWEAYEELFTRYLRVKYEHCCTIHKSQGSTWESVYIDMYKMPSWVEDDSFHRLLYVALTRASKEVVVNFSRY